MLVIERRGDLLLQVDIRIFGVSMKYEMTYDWLQLILLTKSFCSRRSRECGERLIYGTIFDMGAPSSGQSHVNSNLKYDRTTEESRGMPALLIKSPSQFECNSSGWSCSMFEPLFVTAALSGLFVVKEALNSENEIL